MKNNLLKTGLVLAFGLSTAAFAQDFCNATHSGTSVKKTESWAKDDIGAYNYEIWYDGGNNSATFYSDGSFSCNFSGTKDYLCRSGMGFDLTKTWKELGHLYADFSVKKGSLSNIGYSFIGVYGWTTEPLVEFYIVDNWGSDYRPGSWMQHKGTVTVNGVEYDLYYNRQINQPAIINGNTDFDQYYSIRKTASDCGTIDITAHFEEWEKVGWEMGKMYEAKVLGEAGNTSGGASGSFDFNYAKVYVGDGSTTNSSSSATTQSSSSSAGTLTGGTAVPGTIELEDFENQGGAEKEVKIYTNVVGEVLPGAWLEYTIDVKQEGTYDFELLAARADEEGNESKISLLIDGESVGSVSVLTDTDWSDLHYKAYTGTTPSISAGTHTLRLSFVDGYVNVDNIKFATGTTSLAANIHLNAAGKTLQVFDMQGRTLGKVDVANGASIAEALFAKFHKSGVYMVKQGNKFQPVRVNR